MKRIIFFLSLLLTSCNYFSRQTIHECKPKQILLTTVQYQGITFSDTIKTWLPVDTLTNHNDYGQVLIPDTMFQKLKALIDAKLRINFDYVAMIFYNKGRLKNTSVVNLHNVYGFSFFTYVEGKKKLLNFRTFLYDTVRNEFLEIKDLNSYICGVSMTYPIEIINELIPQFSDDWSNALAIISYERALKYKNFKISTTYNEDNFNKNLENYRNKLFYKKYFNKIQ